MQNNLMRKRQQKLFWEHNKKCFKLSKIFMEKIYVQNCSYLFECTYIIKLLKFLPIHAALLRQNIHIQELCTILHIKNFEFDKKRFYFRKKEKRR